MGHEKTCIDTQINNNKKKIEISYNCGRRQEFSSQSFIVRDDFFNTFSLFLSCNFNNDAYNTFSLAENRQLSSSYGLFGVHPLMQQAFIDTYRVNT